MLKQQLMTRNDIQKILDKFDEHERRIRALESLLDAGQKKRILTAKKNPKIYSGPKGGVRLLINDGFFKSKHDLASVRKELANRDYHYSRQAAHEALKSLSKIGGPLVVLKEGKKKLYVERK